MTKQPRHWLHARLSTIATAAGHAIIFWLSVEFLSLALDTEAFGRPTTALLCGFAAWLVCVNRPDSSSFWRFSLAGYLAVILDVAITVAAATTTLMGRIDPAATTIAIAATVPWVLPIWGTLMAGVSIVYGLVLRHLQRPTSVSHPT